MSVIESLAFRESEQTPPLAQVRERIDDAETVADSLCVEAANKVRVLDDQLKRVGDCSRQLAHEWLAFADKSASNYLDLLRGLAAVKGVNDAAAVQLQFGRAQAAAAGDYLKKCCDLSTATAAECSEEK